MNQNLRPKYGFRSNRIPYELERFVRRDTYALLIKGKAGTGKTTLSLTILKTLGQASNFFYISTRISPRQLFTYYPWLEHYVQTLKPLASGDNEEQVSKMAMFEDARLDEPESLFERITNELMDVKAPIIIIDSWDAIASFMDREARLNNERVLQTWRERAGAKLIFISEDVSQSTLDFVVDGIVELDQSSYYSCRLRHIKLLKLRGVKILNQVYSFSLNNSIFTSFASYKPSDYSMHKMTGLQDQIAGRKNFSAKPYSFRGYGRIRTGYPELDTVIDGGLPRKGLIVFKIDPDINTTAITAFFSRIISSFIKRNNPVLIQPIKNASPQMILAFLKSYLGYIPDNRIFRILWSDTKDSDTKQYIDPIQYSLVKNSKSGLIERNIEMTRSMHQDALMLSIFGYEQINGLDEELRQRQTSIFSYLNKNTDITMVVGTSGEPCYPQFESEADMKFEISLVRGTLFLKPVLPVGPIFAITTHKVDGFPRMRLQLLV
jgi:KaiC/GvpD/RAD55 family RecA-like ATPase